MLVAVTSPTKGTGRTMVAITLANLLAKSKGSTSLVDMNQMYDVDYFLNSRSLSKTLDDFCSAEESGMFKAETDTGVVFVRKSTTIVGENLYITGPNNRYELTDDYVHNFVNLNQSMFQHCVVDCREGNDIESSYFYDHADYIVVVLNQDAKSLNYIKQHLASLYAKYGRKLVFVVNKYMVGIGQLRMNFTEAEIKSQLTQVMLHGKMFKLPYSVQLQNDANTKVITNYTSRKNDPYLVGVESLLDYLLGERR